MSRVILDNIPFQPDIAALHQELNLRTDRQKEQLERMVSEARAIARPKAIYGATRVESRGEGHVIIDGIRFDSRVLYAHLEPGQAAYPHVVTCGMELYEWADGLGNALEQFWAEAIKYLALHAASRGLEQHLEEQYQLGKIGCISPGVFPDWPLRGQRPLFQLLGNPKQAIGVQLLKSNMMSPTQSLSGIIFPTKEDFVICELCNTDYCPGRQLPYDETLFDRKYR